MQSGQSQSEAQQFPVIGRWGITAFPDGWRFIPEFGLRQAQPYQATPEGPQLFCSISLTQDPLPEGQTLAEYIEKQKTMIASRYPDAKFAGPQPSPFPKAEEGLMLLVRHSMKDDLQMLHLQNYVRVGEWIGIITLTTPEPLLRAVRPGHEVFVKGLHILPPPPPAPATTGEASQ